eukprot:1957958-Rhodomonas_salina.1
MANRHRQVWTAFIGACGSYVLCSSPYRCSFAGPFSLPTRKQAGQHGIVCTIHAHTCKAMSGTDQGLTAASCDSADVGLAPGWGHTSVPREVRPEGKSAASG